MSQRPEKSGTCAKCGHPHKRMRKGMCPSCYGQDLRRAKREGTFRTPERDIKARILSRIAINEAGCWIWGGALNPVNGYGQIPVNRRAQVVHRVAYEAFVGPIPDGLEIDHVCHSQDEGCPGGLGCPHRPCCNPDHLEAVTKLENNRRSKSPTARNAAKTHCSRGHEFTAENTRIFTLQTSNGPRERRNCRTCERMWQKIARARKGKLAEKPDVQNPRPPGTPKTHCRNGHELTEENTYWHESAETTARYPQCRTCANESAARYRDRKRAERGHPSAPPAAGRALIDTLNPEGQS